MAPRRPVHHRPAGHHLARRVKTIAERLDSRDRAELLERIATLAELAALMREPSRPSERDKDDDS